MLNLPTATVDLESLRVRCGSDECKLTATEGRLLRYLESRRGVTVSKEELQTEVFGYAAGVVTRTVDSTVSRLRQKLEPDPRKPRSLVTVRGKGLMLNVLEATASELGGLVGRGELLVAVEEALRAKRVVQLVGPGGVGKTSLARRLVRKRAHKFVDLSTATTLGETATALLVAMDQLAPKRSELLAFAVANLWSSEHVLVLDNLEQLNAEALAWLHNFAKFVDGGVLCTSRTEHWPDQASFVVGPLSSSDAVELLLRSSRKHAPLAPVSDSREELRALAEAVDFIPLALELMGSRLATFGAQALRAMLSKALTFGDGRQGRHATMNDTIAWSWRLLSRSAVAAATAWSIFPGVVPLAGAAAVAPDEDASACVVELVSAGLAEPTGGGIRMWRMVREVAAGQLNSDARSAAGIRLAMWLLERPRSGDWILEHRDLYSTALSALSPLPAHAHLCAEVGAALLSVSRRLSVEDANWARSVATTAAAGTSEPILHARVLLASIPRGSMDTHQAEQALALVGPEGPRLLRAKALCHLGSVARRAGQVDAAQAHYEAALEVGRDTEVEGRARYELGVLFRVTGDLERAECHLLEAAAAHRAAGNRRGEAGALLSLAAVARHQSRFADGLKLIERSIRLAQAAGEPHVVAEATHNRTSILYSSEGPTDEVLAANLETIQQCRRTGNLLTLSYALGLRGGSLFGRLEVREAEMAFREAERTARVCGALPVASMWRFQVAMCCHQRNAFNTAVPLYRSAIQELTELGRIGLADQARSFLGLLHAERGEGDEARRLFEASRAQLGQPTLDAVAIALLSTRGYALLGDAEASQRAAASVEVDLEMPMLAPVKIVVDRATT